MKSSDNTLLRRLAGVSVIALAVAAAPALAQTAVQTGTSQSSSSASSSAAPAPVPAAKPAPTPAPATQATAGAGSGDATPPADAGPGDSTTITITAPPPKEVVHKADRDVYDTKQDPMAATGSAADVLNNVPGVTVDADGSVALRGNTNVQVYINGKKSTLTSGDNRGSTLLNLAADDIDTTEVMTNPGAAYGADAPSIININLKRGRSINPQTTINVTAGDRGRGSVGFNTGHTFFGNKLTLNGGVRANLGSGGGFGGGRGGGGGGGGGSSSKTKQISDNFQLDPTTGSVIREDVGRRTSKSHSNNVSANMNGTYNLSESQSVDGNLNYTKTKNSSASSSDTQSYNGSHVLTQNYGQLQNNSGANENMNFGLTYDRRGDIGTSEDFKVAYQHGQSLNESFGNTQNIYHFSTAPVPATNTYSASHNKSKMFQDQFSGDWSHPVKDTEEEQAQLQVGWDITNTINQQFQYRSQTSTSPVTSPFLPSPTRVTQFNTNDLLSAAYITWQQQWGKFGYNVGLRVENLDREIESQNLVPTAHPNTPDAVNKSETSSTSYTPSVFLLYSLTEKDRFKLVYTQKIQRPGAQQLNPVIVYSDDLLTASSGNAGLKFAQNNNYELDYNRSGTGGNDLSASLFYSEIDGAINRTLTYIPSPVAGGTPVLLSSWQNTGTSRTTGMNLNYSTSFFSQKLRVRMGGNLSNTITASVDPATLQPLHTSRPSSSMNGMARYAIDTKNSVIANFQFRGQNGDLQSFTTPSSSVTLSYMYQLIPGKANLTFNASNFVVGPLSKRVNQSSITRGFTQTLNPGASFTASLRYTFGAVRQQQRGQGQGNFGPGGQGGQGGQGGGQGGGGGFGGGRGGPGGGF